MYPPPSFSSYQYSANLGNPPYALLLYKNIVSKLKPISKSHLIGGLIISKFEWDLSKAVLCCLILSCDSWHQAFWIITLRVCLPLQWVALPTLVVWCRMAQHGLAWRVKMKWALWSMWRMLLLLGILTASGLFFNKCNPHHQGVTQAGYKTSVNSANV